jgi:hypothetical protein
MPIDRKLVISDNRLSPFTGKPDNKRRMTTTTLTTSAPSIFVLAAAKAYFLRCTLNAALLNGLLPTLPEVL